MHNNRLTTIVTRSIFTLTSMLMLAGLLATSALGAPLPGENPAPNQVVYAPNDVWMWSLQRVDAPRLFFNMTNRSIRADSGGAVHVAYGGDHLYYARYDGTDWKATVVDGAFGVGQHASLALDKNKYPHISYYDYYNGALKYAYYTGVFWGVDVVDTPQSTQAMELQTEEDFVVGFLARVVINPALNGAARACSQMPPMHSCRQTADSASARSPGSGSTRPSP